jgi:hypothetical protein
VNREPKIITGDYEPSGVMNDERNSMMANIIEVKNFEEAKEEFKDFVENGGSSGLF